MSKLLVLSLFTLTFASLSANALPLPKAGQKSPVFSPAKWDAEVAVDSSYNFEGIVALNNCSGAVVRLEKSQDTDLAYVFTNGHCFEGGLIKTGAFIYHKPSTRRMNIMNPTSGVVASLNATEVVYGTMTNTDMAIYRLAVSYAEIKSKYGVSPLTLASNHPTNSTPIEIISGYWRRGYKCQVDGFVNQLKEEDWLWKDSIRYSRPGCETIGGTSGSPIIAAGTRTMIGINNTGNESGEQCTMNNPCEIDEKGSIRYEQGLSYGQQTYLVYTCLNDKYEIDVNVPGCLLNH